MKTIENNVKKAFSAAGWRERYAMEHGAPRVVVIGGHKCIKWIYSTVDPYQDANGATFDTVRGCWIG